MDDYKSKAVAAAEAADLTDEAFAALMASHDTGDDEADHGNGDDVLIVLVRRLGFTQTADAWDKLGKWYA